MNGIKARSYSVEFKQNGFNKLEKLIENNDYSSVFVIVDTNTREHCLPVFKKEMSQPFDFKIISISPGEEFKTIISCQNIWQILSDKGADRKSLIINLCYIKINDYVKKNYNIKKVLNLLIFQPLFFLWLMHQLVAKQGLILEILKIKLV